MGRIKDIEIENMELWERIKFLENLVEATTKERNKFRSQAMMRLNRIDQMIEEGNKDG